ncbi:MAG: methyltransferase domain-containing protein [Planctomycetaceae bacterium]
MIVISGGRSTVAVGALDPGPMLDWIRREAVILQARGSSFGEQAFLCARGRRHPIVSAARLEEYGFRWPADVQQVSERMLATYAPAGGLPQPRRDDFDAAVLGDAMAVREAIAGALDGFGLEIGAGASPFPVPPRCRVIFGDRLTYDQLCAEPYPGQRLIDLVIPDILTDFDSIENVADASLDFLVACHVIEHTRDPIGSIASAWSKLKPGGRLVLVVPDKERTFDRRRPVTPLDHFVEDHCAPGRSRDYAHDEEFYTLSQPIAEDKRRAKVERMFAERYAIHYHAWTHDAFAELLAHVDREVCSWTEIWTHPAVADESRCIEFYAVLVK